MSDGANLGVSAGRALKTILGGDAPPEGAECVSMAELEQRIRSRPLPGEGTKPWEADDKDDAYSVAAEIVAHAFLVLADEDPTLLTRQEFYTEDDFRHHEGEDWWHGLVGKPKDASEVIWRAFTDRWPNGDEWVGGATGFMVGWAFNAARSIKGEPPAPNPAILTVSDGDEGPTS
jgi:hypothetical protein